MKETTSVLYVLKRYPRLSETFIVREILGVEAAGRRVLIDSLLAPETGPRHPDVSQVRAEVRVVPSRPRLRHSRIRRAHAAVAWRRPAVWLGLAFRRRDNWRRFLQAGLVAERVRREGVGHIHAHFASAAAEVARDAARLAGVPFTVTAHAKDIFHIEYEAGLAERVAGAAAVVTVSRHNVDHLTQRLRRIPVAYVPNGMEAASPSNAPAHGPVLCVARLVPKKGVDTLLAAVPAVIEAEPGARIEIIGDGPQRAELEALARELGVAHAVSFLGAQPGPAVAAAYRRASMFVLPCRIAPDGDRDGLPTVLLEAMARGLPVISTDIVGIPELVQHRNTGLVVPPDDPPALAHAVLDLRRDDLLRKRLGAAAREHVGAEYHPGRSTIALLAVFDRVGA